jgi:hypothetical protein
MDRQKVYTKGSEVGYSLMKIEKHLALQLEEKDKLLQHFNHKQIAHPNKDCIHQAIHSLKQNLERSESKILEQHLKPEQQSEQVNPLLVKRKRKPRQQTPHL